MQHLPGSFLIAVHCFDSSLTVPPPEERRKGSIIHPLFMFQLLRVFCEGKLVEDGTAPGEEGSRSAGVDQQAKSVATSLLPLGIGGLHMHIYVYMYVQRRREKVYMNLCVCIDIDIQTCIYTNHWTNEYFNTSMHPGMWDFFSACVYRCTDTYMYVYMYTYICICMRV